MDRNRLTEGGKDMREMKWNQKVMAVTGLLTALVLPATADLFTQDFSSSTVVADYVDATAPTKNQFSLINGPVWSIEAGRIKMVKPAGSAGNLRRWVAMEGTPVSAMSFSFDMEVTGFSEAAGTRLYTGVIGEPVGGGNWMAWGIDATGVANEWTVKGASQTFTGEQTIRIELNATGADLDYTDPLGGTQTLADNSYDIWVGTTLVIDGNTDNFVTPENQLTSFTFGMPSEPAATYYFDNFSVVPEPATLGLFGLSSGLLLAFRKIVNR
jgi:hypothetical protein